MTIEQAAALNLKQFCLEDDPECPARYPGMLVPFRQGDFIYATNTRVAVCVPFRPQTESLAVETDGKVPKMESLEWANWDLSAFEPWPALDLQNHRSTCEECDGTGMVDRCKYCDHGKKCDECDGEGDRVFPSIQVLADLFIDYRYDAMIRTLPNVRFVRRGVNPRDSQIIFAFDVPCCDLIGKGIVMPRLKDEDL